MKKFLSLFLCFVVSLLLIGCVTDKNNGFSTSSNSATTQEVTTSATNEAVAKYEQPPVQSPLENDKYPTVSHITIYKNGGMRYDITDRKEIERICDYYMAIEGDFVETRVSICDLPNEERVEREIRFFMGGYEDQKILGSIQMTNKGRYCLSRDGVFDIYLPEVNDAVSYQNYFDDIFSSQTQPYMDVFTR
jgi:hypothetical protein